ncbi:UNVERIFIED_CONTAM: hypothetical protein GTU68_057209 [Idotea baltica]|nr:hypothetical protein [Idotea baltica]
MLSNNGPLAQRFEAALAQYLGVEHISLVANAFLGIVLALRQMGVTSGEVITTPFSFVATSHAIRWVGATPVFADIDPDTLNLDPEQVERHISPQTRAILPVHIYGTPCDISGFSTITKRHNIPVIYDAAHAFGVRNGTQSILNYGEMSVLSFHATKVFNTFEGGAVISGDRETKLAVDRLSNFGIVNEEQTDTIGLNAKMSEINAAIGLAQLSHVDHAILARKTVSQRYIRHFKGITGLRCLCDERDLDHNYYSFPILLSDDYPENREQLYARLKAHDIYARRYYSPLISDLPIYNNLQSADPSNLPVATRAASQILCLPMFPDLCEDEQMEIIDLVSAP